MVFEKAIIKMFPHSFFNDNSTKLERLQKVFPVVFFWDVAEHSYLLPHHGRGLISGFFQSMLSCSCLGDVICLQFLRTDSHDVSGIVHVILCRTLTFGYSLRAGSHLGAHARLRKRNTLKTPSLASFHFFLCFVAVGV